MVVNGRQFYTVSLDADAGTARVLAQSRSATISSDRAVESGTVCLRASNNN